uniref:phosphatidyl-N-methylethanolamine N-methyltransferase n=1 Tax=Chloropicon laureae TaxID=464258 RepID=A0A7S2YVX3_9CHLO|mmetsp:Transcript_18776/g.39104  ORF Transcript_18776/g.39104 Transcript_18776/m.39104 type:complete len:183 (-) Transcript_18776:67-615(-)|eukprot:CAMPEP_0197490338 /NCGR_PEP_ID=MMETSP1311-20131121/4899_1 /TAXON_ID=464262 /ORGANISM="Genus nov. species nov., Strain RCC856" /LENGTH=182 /DNA_ID=CAMNT_0043034841 /DNA_START=298 /DNA_END=846 /DNA_ORIENTATION=+
MMQLAQVLLYLAIPMPHAFYAFLWTKPKVWKGVAKKVKVHPVELLAFVAACMKVIQALSFVFYIVTLLGTNAFVETWEKAHPFTLLFGGMLFAAGQTLNMGVYKTLGFDGVYYGFKYGKKVPWVTGFPFNICPHPQYIGSSLSIWGALWPIMRVHTGEFFDLLAVGCYWSAMYMTSSIIESH